MISTSPVELGLPPKFAQWRESQSDAIECSESSSKRFVVQCAPTGFGKSLVYLANAMLEGGRVCILTSTKGLQSQLMRDFKQCGLVDIRGMNAYPCLAANHYGLPPYTDCADGPCHFGAPCNLKTKGGCLYYDAQLIASKSRLVVTNYSYWMYSNKFSVDGVGDFSLLILDEAHDAPEALGDFAGVNLDMSEVAHLLDDGRYPDTLEIRDWKEWALYKSAPLAERLAEITARVTNASAKGSIPSGLPIKGRKLKLLAAKLQAIAEAYGPWSIEVSGRRARLDPLWPAPYAEKYLFCGVPKVILFSATVRPKTMQLLGVKPQDFDFHEYKSNFPLDRRPVVYVPTVNVRHAISDGELRDWVGAIDNILRFRLDRKGIIHTTSYNRRDVVVHNSEFRRHMLWHGTDDRDAVVARFRNAKPPAILVSPSVTTGWDFPGRDCEFQIISKVPFPDQSSRINQARCAVDRDYSIYSTVQTLVQTTGRGMRSVDDRCETIIIDDNVSWLIDKYGEKFAPKWWLDSFTFSRTIPIPPEKL